MKITKERAQANRQRIVETAAVLFRDRGFEGIGVADLMKASGLTHGGFYRHFQSKDDLVAEATSTAYQQFEMENAGKSIAALLERYISTVHRDDLANACPTSTLGGDAMRQSGRVKTVFAEGVERWIHMIGEALAQTRPSDDPNRRAMAIDLAARAVGAIVLARAASANQSLSQEVLETSLARALTDLRDTD